MHLISPGAKPLEQTTAIADDEARIRYLRSYLWLRAMIGIIGIGLPLTLMIGDGFFLSGEIPRGSLSAYYHTGMRDFFVGTLCTVSIFLITYEFFRYTWYNLLTVIAGIAAWGVAIFPTGGNSPLTPLQDRLGERPVSTVHMICAAVFILSLAVISFLFGRREEVSIDHRAGNPGRRKLLHWGCGFVILGAVAYVLVTKWSGVSDEHSLFYGETVATLAFGLSWLVKGRELSRLLRLEQSGATGPAADSSR